MTTALAIGEVARRAGLNTSAIRYYERSGLLPAPARTSGRRTYDESVLTRLHVIAVAKQAGFTLEETRTLLAGFDAGGWPSEHWRGLAQAKLAEIDALIARAQAMRALLEDSLECGCRSLEACEIFAPAA